MENEVDRLEIVVEAEANRANRSMTALEKKIDKVAESLERCMLIAQGAVSLKGINIEKLFSGPAMEKSAKQMGKKLANDLVKNFNLNSAGQDVEKQVRTLTNKISKGLAANSGNPYKGYSEDAEELGRIVAKNGKIAKSTVDDYQRLYKYIRETGKIKLSTTDAKSLGDSYKERTPVLKQKMSTASGTELDSYYKDLQAHFPDILKETGTVEDQFHQLDDALRHFYETANGFEKPDWLEQDAYESVISGIDEISTGIKQAKKESGDFGESLKGIEDTGKSFSEMFGAGMDTSGLERAQRLVGDIAKGNRTESQKNTRSDLKYPVQPFSEINRKFKDSTLTTDYSSMSTKELQADITKNKRAYARVKQAISDMISLEGTDELGGKDWYNKIMQMNQYENAIDSATEALGKLSTAESTIAIKRAENDGATHYEPKSSEVSAESMNYNPDAMKAVFGEGAENIRNFDDVLNKFGGTAREAIGKLNSSTESLNTEKINTYEAQIKRLKNELTNLASQGFTQGDLEYDNVARELAEVTEAKRRYDKEMRNSAKAELGAEDADKAANSLKRASGQAGVFRRTLNGVKSAGSRINSIHKSFDKVSKSIKNARDLASKAIHPFRTLKNLMSGSEGKSGNGMGLGRMIGSSIMFSGIFGAISQIKSAVKEGSDNLVQYSSEYNKTISGLVSSLMYLKNAWAAAFAPIINVVGPYISSFIDMISGALNAVGQFMSALTGKGFAVQAKKAWSDYASSLDSTKKSADSAADSVKDLQNYTLGIDELNIIQPSSSGSGSSGSGSSSDSSSPSASDMFETVEVSNSMNKLADKFKEAIKNSDFTDIGRMVGNKLSSAMESIPWNTIYQKADNFGKDLATFLNGLISPRLFYDLGSTIAGALNTALHAQNSFAINFDWKNLGKSLASSLKGFFTTWDAGLTGETFSNFVTGIIEGITAFVNGLQEDDTFKDIGQKLVDLICGIDWMKITWDLYNLVKSLASAIVNLPIQLLEGAIEEIIKKATGKEIKIKFPKISFPHLPGIADFIELGRNLMDGMLKGITSGEWGNPKKFIKDRIFTPFITWFKSLFGIHSPSTVMAEQGQYIMQGLFDGINSKLESIKKFFTDLREEIKTIFSKIDDWFSKKFQSARDGVTNAFSNVGKWFSDRYSDIQNGMKNVSSWFGAKFRSARSLTNSAFSSVGTWFGNRRADIQKNVQSISSWFGIKFNSARSLTNSAFSNIGSWFGNRREDIKTNMRSISQWFKDIFSSAYNGITSIFDNVGGYFERVAGWIKSPVLKAVKAIAKAVNWVYKKLGGDGSLIDVSGLDNYASGTNGVAKDSFGIVNDQSGNTYRELVQYPNGKMIIPTGRNVVLPMPKGTKVMPANQTAALMGMTGTKKYKSGIGNFFGNTAEKIKDIGSNVFSYIKNPEKLLQAAIDKFANLTGALEPGLTLAKSAVDSVFDTAVSKVKGFFDSFGSVSYNSSAGVEQWRNLAKQALVMTNQFSESNLNALLTQMMHESGGNPNAINNWDINAINGTPSKGLMQVIDPTFYANAMPGYNTNVYDPLSNMIAAINYTVKRYGSLYAGWTARGYKGYKTGGMPINGEVYVANEGGFGSEYIGNIGNRHVVANNQQITSGISKGVEDANDETNALLRQVIENQERILKKDTSTRLDSKKVNRQLSRGSRNSGYSFSTV